MPPGSFACLGDVRLRSYSTVNVPLYRYEVQQLTIHRVLKLLSLKFLKIIRPTTNGRRILVFC